MNNEKIKYQLKNCLFLLKQYNIIVPDEYGKLWDKVDNKVDFSL